MNQAMCSGKYNFPVMREKPDAQTTMTTYKNSNGKTMQNKEKSSGGGSVNASCLREVGFV